VLLAAGLGARLGPSAENLPKGFLRLGDRPIVEESVRCLLALGVERVVIGTGFQAERYDALAAGLGGRVHTVLNPEFATSGSLHTFALTTPEVEDDFLLLESDLIYEARAIVALQAADTASTLLVSGFTGAGDEVFVQADPDLRLTALSKTRGDLGERVVGELVGLTRITRRTRDLMLAYAQARSTTARRLDYETALAAASVEDGVRCLVIEDLIWSEIDDDRQLVRAREDVYPRIRMEE